MNPSSLMQRLSRADIAPSRQRLRIAAVLLGEARHMTAEQVCDELRRQGENVSRATVYATLRLMSERGLLRPLAVPGREQVFDSNTHPHHHCYDVDSGKVMDLDDQAGPNWTAPPGWQVEGVELMIRVRRQPD